MAKSVFRRSAGGTGEVSINMTPMIDCTFLLIIFFILTTKIASEQFAKVEIPKPTESQALEEKMDEPNRVLVNVVSRARVRSKGEEGNEAFLASQAERYEVLRNKIQVGDLQSLVEIFRDRKAKAESKGLKEFFVEIRADKRVNFAFVEPVMAAATEAGVQKMHIIALVKGSQE